MEKIKNLHLKLLIVCKEKVLAKERFIFFEDFSLSFFFLGYYGVFLVGKALGDQYLTRWASLLLQTEIRSTKMYYHMMPDRYDSFPITFTFYYY